MEYIDGADLVDVLNKAEGPLEIPMVYSVFAQLTKVVSYMHTQGLVHRDIKPDNVVLMPNGIVKVWGGGGAV